jgi:hypothetical protein
MEVRSVASDAIVDIIRNGTKLDTAIGRKFVRDLSAVNGTTAFKEFGVKYKLRRADLLQIPNSTKLIEAMKIERDRQRAGKGNRKSTNSILV